MESKMHYLAALSFIDSELDELQEEFGDLPDQVHGKLENLERAKAIVDETRGILDEIKNFVATAKVTLVELKEKEEALAKQQFLVRNNKEFDAITKEIDHLKHEHESLSTRMRTEGLKEENINRILLDQIKDQEKAQEEYDDRKAMLDNIASDQNDTVKDYNRKRKTIVLTLDQDYVQEYERIRKFHKDAAVQVRKNSCSGCFSSVPSQKIVELRNNPEKLFLCENCGRILLDEELYFDESLLDNI